MCINLFWSRTTAIYILSKQVLAHYDKYIYWQKRKRFPKQNKEPNPSRASRIKSRIFYGPSVVVLSSNIHTARIGTLQICNLPILQRPSWHVSKNSVNTKSCWEERMNRQNFMYKTQEEVDGSSLATSFATIGGEIRNPTGTWGKKRRDEAWYIREPLFISPEGKMNRLGGRWSVLTQKVKCLGAHRWRRRAEARGREDFLYLPLAQDARSLLCGVEVHVEGWRETNQAEGILE